MHYLLIEGEIKEREKALKSYIIYDIQMQFNPCRQSEHCEEGAAFGSPRVCRAPKGETLKGRNHFGYWSLLFHKCISYSPVPAESAKSAKSSGLVMPILCATILQTSLAVRPGCAGTLRATMAAVASSGTRTRSEVGEAVAEDIDSAVEEQADAASSHFSPLLLMK